MAQENKAVDLGKLQDQLRHAEANLRKAVVISLHADDAMRRAQSSADKAKKKSEEALRELDKARQAVLDGARSIAQG